MCSTSFINATGDQSAVDAIVNYQPLAASLATEASPANRDVPLFLAHGTDDDIVEPARGEATRDALSAMGYPVQWHTYAMGHTVCPEEVADLNRWLLAVLVA